MTTEMPVDFKALDDATRSLLGYFVHVWYRHYLAIIAKNAKRYLDLGLVEPSGRPTAKGRYTLLFDFPALDLEKFCYINGIYFHILTGHKSANHRLMNRFDGKQVMYLRGYDFEASVATGGGVAAGFSSIDTQQFNGNLGQHLAPHCLLYKILSPKDVYWETSDAMRLYYGDFEKIIAVSRHRFLSVYLNALDWKVGVEHLLDRMDHYVVYVASMTESALWELSRLDTDDRRQRVTVVFDDEAIRKKDVQLGLQESFRGKFGDQLIWSKAAQAQTLTIDALRADLSSKFFVTTPDDFETNIDKHRSRILASSSTLCSGGRETWIDFKFHPAVDDTKLVALRGMSAWVEAEIDKWVGTRGIDCLPSFLNLVQLKIFITLLLGEHRETGRALAAYAAVMQAAQDYFADRCEKPGALSEEGCEHNLALLSDHLERARHIGWFMFSFGKTHEFKSLPARVELEFKEVFDRTKSAVDNFFAVAVARNKR